MEVCEEREGTERMASDSVVSAEYVSAIRALFFLFLAYSGLVYAAGRKKNEKKTH